MADRGPDEDQELARCEADASYFVNTYCKIKADTGAGLVPFHLFDYQETLLHDFLTHQEVIVLKARQLGITELLAAYALWRTLIAHQDVIIVSQGEDEAQEFVKKALLAWEHLPLWLRVPLLNPTKTTSMVFSNHSRILPKAATSRAGRGYNAQLLIFDEWAHQLFQDAIYAAAAPTALSAGNQIIGVSTANGAGNMFHRQWERAVNGSGAHAVFLAWHARPGRDAAWFADATKSMEDWQRDQEFPDTPEKAFILSGRPRFDQAALTELMAQTCDPIAISQLGADSEGRASGWLRVWEHPRFAHRYVIGADTAEGLAKGDYSAAVVLDCETGLDVATLHGHWDSEEYAGHLAALGRRYHDALLGVERNNHGHTVLQCLKSTEQYKDERLYHHVEYDNHRKKVISRPLGWQTSSKSKPIMIDDLGATFRERRPWRNRAMISEARTYVIGEDGDTGASGCFAPGTPILLADGTMLPIEWVHYDNTVVTHLGRRQNVIEATSRHHEGDLITVSIQGVPWTMSATPEHPFWARKRTSKTLQGYAARKEYPASWVAAKDLAKGDWLCVPKRSDLPPTEYTPEQLYAIGFWLAEGSMRDAHHPGLPPRGICLDNTTLSFIDRAGDTLSSWFTHDYELRGNASAERHAVEVPARVYRSTRVVREGFKLRHHWRLYSREAAAFFAPFKREGPGMKVIPDEIFCRSGLLPLVSGFIDGDGHQRRGQQQDVTFTTVSGPLATQLRQICLDAGVWCTLHRKTVKPFYSTSLQAAIPNPQPLWLINIKASFLHLLPPCMVVVPNRPKLRRVLEDAAAFYTPITAISHCPYSGPVYNVGVEGDSSYVAGGVAVHNSLFDDLIVAYAIAEQIRQTPAGPLVAVGPRMYTRRSTWRTG